MDPAGYGRFIHIYTHKNLKLTTIWNDISRGKIKHKNFMATEFRKTRLCVNLTVLVSALTTTNGDLLFGLLVCTESVNIAVPGDKLFIRSRLEKA